MRESPGPSNGPGARSEALAELAAIERVAGHPTAERDTCEVGRCQPQSRPSRESGAGVLL